MHTQASHRLTQAAFSPDGSAFFAGFIIALQRAFNGGEIPAKDVMGTAPVL
jgi:hypothetical protein